MLLRINLNNWEEKNVKIKVHRFSEIFSEYDKSYQSLSKLLKPTTDYRYSTPVFIHCYGKNNEFITILEFHNSTCNMFQVCKLMQEHHFPNIDIDSTF